LNKFVSLSNEHWVCLYASLSPENDRSLKRYFGSVYPREYVRKLIAALEDLNVQHAKISGKEKG